MPVNSNKMQRNNSVTLFFYLVSCHFRMSEISELQLAKELVSVLTLPFALHFYRKQRKQIMYWLVLVIVKLYSIANS